MNDNTSSSPTWYFTIPYAEEQILEGERHTVYYIKVERTKEIWAVQRRYGELKELHQKIQLEFPQAELKFPVNKFISTMAKAATNIANAKREFIQQRRMKLETYLSQLSYYPEILQSEVFTAFIDKTSTTQFKKAYSTLRIRTETTASRPNTSYWVTGMKLQATMWYSARYTDEISISKGDILTYLGTTDDTTDRVHVSLRNSTGWVPTRSVHVLNTISTPESASSSPQIPSSPSALGQPRTSSQRNLLQNSNNSPNHINHNHITAALTVRRGSSQDPEAAGHHSACSPPTIGLNRSASDQNLASMATLFEQLEDTEISPRLNVSEATRAKVKHTKEYFNEYYRDLVSYLQERRRRQLKMESELESIISQEAKRILLEQHHRRETRILRMKRIRMDLNDFEMLDMIGRGGFGRVYLSKNKHSGELVALKKIKKAVVLERNKVESIRTEREVLKGTESPWLIKLICSFQDERYLYFAMEFAPGGNLKNLLEIRNILCEQEAKFYICEMMAALNSLHELGFIHRDLKPDNFLFDKHGHIKLADFGLSKGGILRRSDHTTKIEPVRIYLADGTFRTLALTNIISRGGSLPSNRGDVFSPSPVAANVMAIMGKKLDMSEEEAQRYLLYEVFDGKERRVDLEENILENYNSKGENRRLVYKMKGDHELSLNDLKKLGLRRSKSYSFRAYRASRIFDYQPTEEELAAARGEQPQVASLQQSTGKSDGNEFKQRREQAKNWPKKAMYSFVGSPHYMAPEIISRNGYDELVDWWSIGCILYEMISGIPPFLGDTPNEVFANILDHENTLIFPDEEDPVEEDEPVIKMSETCKDLIRKLLSPVNTRLGKKGAFQEIVQHPFFKGVEWKDLRKQTPPFIPKLSSPTDTSYFHMDDEEKDSSESSCSGTSSRGFYSISADDSATFGGGNSPRTERRAGEQNNTNNNNTEEESATTSANQPRTTNPLSPKTTVRRQHKRNNSFDFVGFTFKPTSWIDIKQEFGNNNNNK